MLIKYSIQQQVHLMAISLGIHVVVVTRDHCFKVNTIDVCILVCEKYWSGRLGI